MNKLTLKQTNIINFAWNHKQSITHFLVGVDCITFQINDNGVVEQFKALFGKWDDRITINHGIVVWWYGEKNEMDAKWA